MTAEAAIPPDLLTRIRQIAADEVAKFARSGFLRNASITDGALTIQNGILRIMYPEEYGGGVAVYYGNLVSAATGEYLGTGMLVQKPDGTDVASFSWDQDDNTLTAHLHDDQNNIIVSNDKVAGQWLARPYIPIAFTRTRFADMSVASTSTTFETLWNAVGYKQHPTLLVGVRATMDVGGAAGELRVLVNGVQLDTTRSVGFAIATQQLLGSVAGAHMSQLTVEVQGRVVSGGGSIRVEPLYAIGRES